MPTKADVLALGPSRMWSADSGFYKDAGVTACADGDTVQQWNADAGGNATQATSANRPHFRANLINGFGALETNPTGDLFLGFTEDTGIREVFIVAKHRTGNQIDVGILGDSTTFNWTGDDADGTKIIDSSGNASPFITGGSLRINATNQSSVTETGGKRTSWSIYTFQTTAAVAANQISRDRSFAGREWDGWYAEIILFDSVLTSAQRTTVETYLSQKYAIAIPLEPADWSGQPSVGAVGDSTNIAYNETPAAKWVRERRQAGAGTQYVGVIAFHYNGIQKVSFSLHGGTWTDVTTMTPRKRDANGVWQAVSPGSIKPYDGTVWAYWFPFDVSTLAGDGWAELRAIVTPATSGTQLLLPSLFVAANGHGTIPTTIYHWDYPNAVSDGSGAAGSPFKNWHTLWSAINGNATPQFYTIICDSAGSYAVTAEISASLTYPVTIVPEAGLSSSQVILVAPQAIASGPIAHIQSNPASQSGTWNIQPGLRYLTVKVSDDWAKFFQWVSTGESDSFLVLDGMQQFATNGLTDDWTYYSTLPTHATWAASTKTITATGAFTDTTLTGRHLRVFSGTGVTPTPAATLATITRISNDQISIDESISATDLTLTDLVAKVATAYYGVQYSNANDIFAIDCTAHDAVYGFYSIDQVNPTASKIYGTLWASCQMVVNARAVGPCDNGVADAIMTQPHHGDVYQWFGNTQNVVIVNNDNTQCLGNFFPTRLDQSVFSNHHDYALVNVVFPNLPGTYDDCNGTQRHILLINCTRPGQYTSITTDNMVRHTQPQLWLFHKCALYDLLSTYEARPPQTCRFSYTNSTGSTQTYHFSVHVPDVGGGGGTTYSSDAVTPPADTPGLGGALVYNPSFGWVNNAGDNRIMPTGLSVANGATVVVWFNLLDGRTAQTSLTLTVTGGAGGTVAGNVQESAAAIDCNFETGSSFGSGATAGAAGYAASDLHPTVTSALLKANRPGYVASMIPFDVTGVQRGSFDAVGAFAGPVVSVPQSRLSLALRLSLS